MRGQVVRTLNVAIFSYRCFSITVRTNDAMQHSALQISINPSDDNCLGDRRSLSPVSPCKKVSSQGVPDRVGAHPRRRHTFPQLGIKASAAFS